ncbi:endonuclease MutS2 [Synechococcus sp. M16CYN]|uniref:endonuclease MutS2 n=1 Tax=Synechococcus sp. M16CYN TaxID=3103139 RepID=UPI0032486197
MNPPVVFPPTAVDSVDGWDRQAFLETLELLEWHLVCEHLASFASTRMGIEAARTAPLPSSLAITLRRQAETAEIAVLDELIEGGLSFRGIQDLKPVLSRCSKGGVAAGEELLTVAETLAASRRLRYQIDDRELRPVCSALVEAMVTLPGLEQRLKFSLEEGGRVADRASASLAALRQRRHVLRQERRDKLQALLNSCASFLQDSVIAERQSRPVLAVKAGAVGQVPGQVHDSSASGNTVFIEPRSVLSIGNQLVDLEARINEEEQRVLGKLSALIAADELVLKTLVDSLLTLDLALARGRYGRWLGGTCPRLEDTPDAPFQLNNLRHPLLVWQQKRSGGPAVVPISVDVSSWLRVVTITGPNTGGKSVSLKSVGLAALMARAGMFLPCSGQPSLPWCAQVLADIGDEQSLQQSLSTFGGHVKRISRILEALQSGPAPALVLLDEVGAGTDPSEGTALATALLKALADRARLTIATTHFNELKALKYNDTRFENASVAFNAETLSPTYELLWGIPGRSNALAVATCLGLDPMVLEQARALLAPTPESEVNSVIQGLEEQRQRQQTAAEDAAALLARTELLHEELLLCWHKQKQQTALYEEQGRQRLEHAIREGQKEVRSLIRRLRDDSADGETARQVGQRLRKIEGYYRPNREKSTSRSVWRPKVGDRIRLLALGKAAEVLSMSDNGLQLTVRCGVMRTTVDIGLVESLDGRKPEPFPPPVVKVKARPQAAGGAQVRTTHNTLDVRGMRVHEAEASVEERLRNANGPIWVIHGIGTGRLKRGLRTWLGTVPYVERVVDARNEDGGPGCSVIWVY